MVKPNLAQIWEAILLLRKNLKSFEGTFNYVILSFQNDTIDIMLNRYSRDAAKYPSIVISHQPISQLNGLHSRFSPNGLTDVQLRKSGEFSSEQIAFLKLYLPYALLPVYAKNEKRTITISHFAQSLDGKIATNSGKSQWIGNKENLIHAHRMRALSDAILIGSNTLKTDNPALTVREVTGDDPIKVVIGSSNVLDFKKLLKNDARVLYITNCKVNKMDTIVETIDSKSDDGLISCQDILNSLFAKGIHSIYIEGGNKTSSLFLNECAIDIVQLHIAPLIMGSGIDNFSLPSINSIDESITFSKYFFTPIGDHIMFTGEVLRK